LSYKQLSFDSSNIITLNKIDFLRRLFISNIVFILKVEHNLTKLHKNI